MAGLRRLAGMVRNRLDFSDGARIKRIRKNPPPVERDWILFVSSEDYSGNPKALFRYMIDQGLNKKYRITWLFEKRENMIDFNLPNVESVCMYNNKGERSFASQQAAMKAGYLFYSHNLNWVRDFREEQTFVDLWHGCGYKRDLKSDKTKVRYDYMIVVGKIYIDIFREIMHNEEGTILDLGYPRNEFFFTDRPEAKEYVAELKKNASANRSIVWMPTFRRTHVRRLDMDLPVSETGLPILSDRKTVRDLDDFCRENGVLLMVKRHHLQIAYDAGPDLTNIVFVDGDDLKRRNIDLYEFVAEADALLTDYSSAAIDYMLLDKPIGYTLDDFSEYEEARGWDLDPVRDYMPGHHMYTLEDMKAFVLDIAGEKDPFREDRNRIKGELHTHFDGFSRRITEYFGL